MSAGKAHENRLKRMQMRSWRRGMKEMDLILGRFADEALAGMDAEGLDQFDALLGEADQDLYQWVTGQRPAPARFSALISAIAVHAGKRGAAGPRFPRSF